MWVAQVPRRKGNKKGPSKQGGIGIALVFEVGVSEESCCGGRVAQLREPITGRGFGGVDVSI